MLDVFYKEFEYRWNGPLGEKCFLSKDEKNPLKYKVPTDLGIIALCANYKIKKGFDIRFCPNIIDLPAVLEVIYQQVKDFDGECKKALIYSITGSGVGLDKHKQRPTHVAPILFCKYFNPKKEGDYKVGIFFMDSTRQMDKVNGTEEIREFMYQKRFIQGDQDTILPLFTLKLETQSDNFSCRIKSVVDMRRALSLNGDNDFFRDQVYENWNNDIPIFLNELPSSLHKTTQNQKVLGEYVRDQESLEFFKIIGDRISKVKRPKYLFHKTQSYLADLEVELGQDHGNFLANMLEQSCPKGGYDIEITRCMNGVVKSNEPLSSPSIVGVVQKSIGNVLKGNIDGARL